MASHPFFLRLLQFSILSTSLLFSGLLHSDQPASGILSKKVIVVTLGDYRYHPQDIQLYVDQPVLLRLVNTDTFTPHTFTLPDDSDGLDVDVDIPAGETVEVNLMPLVAGSHTFYCTNTLPFMDSHREKGMEGRLTVISDIQANHQ
jgi:plastocyanin